MLITTSGDYWVLPYSSHFINYTREHGLNDAGIRAIAEDHDGNLWIGSESGGAMKIARGGFISYSEADGLEHSRIAALGEDRDGELFVVTRSLHDEAFHIHRFDGRHFENIRINLPSNVVPTWGWNQLFVQDQLRQWWVPTSDGLFQFPALQSIYDLSRVRPVKDYTAQNGLSGNEVFRVFEDCACACGYLLKKTPWVKLVESLREAIDGGSPMSPEVARRVIDLLR